MTHLQLPQSSPSWALPIAIGALFAVLVQTLPLMVAPLASVYPCCCAIELLPAGALPAFIALRRDPDLTPGQGFAVAFIAVGLGSVITAFALTSSMETDPVAREQEFRKGLEAMSGQMPEPMPPEELDQAAAMMAEVAPYLPATCALVFTVLAGLCGLLTVLLLRGKKLPPMQPSMPQ